MNTKHVQQLGQPMRLPEELNALEAGDTDSLLAQTDRRHRSRDLK